MAQMTKITAFQVQRLGKMWHFQNAAMCQSTIFGGLMPRASTTRGILLRAQVDSNQKTSDGTPDTAESTMDCLVL